MYIFTYHYIILLVCVCMYVRTYVRMYVCMIMYVCMYVNKYVWPKISKDCQYLINQGHEPCSPR